MWRSSTPAARRRAGDPLTSSRVRVHTRPAGATGNEGIAGQCWKLFLRTKGALTPAGQIKPVFLLDSAIPAGVTTYETHFNAFKQLGSKLANLKPGLANVCSPLFYCEGLCCEVHLINCLRIALNFSQGQVSANRCNLMRRPACFEDEKASASLKIGAAISSIARRNAGRTSSSRWLGE